MKTINFLNAILIAYCNTRTSVLIDTKYSVVFLIRKKIVDQNNSAGSGDYRMSPNEKKSKNIYSKLLNFRKKTQISIKVH